MSSVIRSIVTVLSRLRGGAIEITNAGYEWQVDQINRREKTYSSMTDEELEQHVAEIRKRVRDRAGFEDVLLDAFALVREAARRTVGMRPFDVQILAALAMHDGKLVEMQTGEGKTLAAVLPASLRAFLGCGVHVLTFNDYLAARDAEWMGPVYRFLDLSVGYVAQGMTADDRRAAYRCDVTYVTAKEAGFDFLRDQLCQEPAKLLQRGFYYAIVDEADSILIDEARVPLVLAGAADEGEPRDSLYRLAEIVRKLRRGVDYGTTAGWRNVNFESAGFDRLQRELRCGELHAEKNVELLTRLNSCAPRRSSIAPRRGLPGARRRNRPDRRADRPGGREPALAIRAPGRPRSQGRSGDSASGQNPALDYTAAFHAAVRVPERHDRDSPGGRGGVLRILQSEGRRRSSQSPLHLRNDQPDRVFSLRKR